MTARNRLQRSMLEGRLAPLGAFVDIAKRARRTAFGGPLNGQAFRRLIVEGVIAACEARVAIETGSHRGTTTEFLSSTSVDEVWTVEYLPRYYWYTRWRFRSNPRVNVVRGDSRTVLRELAGDPDLTARSTLFYLDAHWGADLPLAEELRIIAGSWSRWVAVIDDFLVPDDPGYRYDAYTPEATIEAAYCKRAGIPGLRIYYPALESKYETGARRGCGVVTSVPALCRQLEAMPSLLRAESDEPDDEQADRQDRASADDVGTAQA